MPRYDALPANLPPRGLAREAAAQYIGISPTKFDEMIADGRIPKPVRIDGRRVWDVRALDQAFDALDGQTAPAPPEVNNVVLRSFSGHLDGNKDVLPLDGESSRTIIQSRGLSTEEKEMHRRHGKWRYVHHFDDRHGKVRNYFRRDGYPSVTLPEDDTTLEFDAAYAAALAGEAVPKRVLKKTPISLHSVDAVVGRCLASNRFLNAPEASRHQLAWMSWTPRMRQLVKVEPCP